MISLSLACVWHIFHRFAWLRRNFVCQCFLALEKNSPVLKPHVSQQICSEASFSFELNRYQYLDFGRDGASPFHKPKVHRDKFVSTICITAILLFAFIWGFEMVGHLKTGPAFKISPQIKKCLCDGDCQAQTEFLLVNGHTVSFGDEKKRRSCSLGAVSCWPLTRIPFVTLSATMAASH